MWSMAHITPMRKLSSAPFEKLPSSPTSSCLFRHYLCANAEGYRHSATHNSTDVTTNENGRQVVIFVTVEAISCSTREARWLQQRRTGGHRRAMIMMHHHVPALTTDFKHTENIAQLEKCFMVIPRFSTGNLLFVKHSFSCTAQGFTLMRCASPSIYWTPTAAFPGRKRPCDTLFDAAQLIEDGLQLKDSLFIRICIPVTEHGTEFCVESFHRTVWSSASAHGWLSPRYVCARYV